VSAFGGERAGGLRTIRIVLVLVACGVCMNTAGVVTTFVLNSDRVDQINQERFTNVERNCLDVNARHDRAVRTVEGILSPRLAEAGPAERERLEASRETTVQIIEALTPKRDCQAFAREQVKNP
jgi:hypothetical protein